MNLKRLAGWSTLALLPIGIGTVVIFVLGMRVVARAWGIDDTPKLRIVKRRAG